MAHYAAVEHSRSPYESPRAADRRITELMDQPWAPVRELWGTDPTAQAGQRAMMNATGGPAPQRTRPRPAAWAARDQQEVSTT